MQFFIDSADSDEIRAFHAVWPLDGATTNPSLLAKSGGQYRQVLLDICGIVSGPVSAEVVAEDSAAMLREAESLAKIADNICIKLPMGYEGLRACQTLTAQGKQTNMTLCFSLPQAVLAAKAGASFISPFVGRLEDSGGNGLQLLAEIRKAYDFYGFKTKILAASLRNMEQVAGAMLAGADCATLPPKLLRALARHPLTDKGLAMFKEDWEKTRQIIGGGA